ncbi:MAG: methionyl-tRNA formyltransferase [Gemmatimonadota bacterium]
MRIIFWGTPDFAVPSLRALQEEGHLVAAVVTQPDRPAGRGLEVRPGAVKREAEAEGIDVLQPENPNAPEFLDRLRALEPELSVVVAYGRILSPDLVDLPSSGSVNVHASLLPELRGAGPVNWAIIRGHEKSGVTIMRIVPELDAGPILYRVESRFPPDITAGELSERLSEMGAAALVEALAQMEGGTLPEVDQDDARATYAPKLDRDMARLDWNLGAAQLDRWIRGCDPWPAAWTTLAGEPVQLFSPEVAAATGPAGSADESSAEPGTVVAADAKGGLRVATGAGVLSIGEVKPAGRARMESAAWVAGRGVATGDRFV